VWADRGCQSASPRGFGTYLFASECDEGLDITDGMPSTRTTRGSCSRFVSPRVEATAARTDSSRRADCHWNIFLIKRPPARAARLSPA